LEARREGRPIQTADGWIAASALYYQVALVTNNASDYQAVGQLQVLTGMHYLP
jgi:predicted nucleic acid-binding protein